jgi:hypothetical protein
MDEEICNVTYGADVESFAEQIEEAKAAPKTIGLIYQVFQCDIPYQVRAVELKTCCSQTSLKLPCLICVPDMAATQPRHSTRNLARVILLDQKQQV